MRRGSLLAMFLVCIALAAVWFKVTHGSADQTVEQWANELHEQMTPPDATTLEWSPIGREKFSATVTWKIETRENWPDYSAWAKNKLAPNYKLVSSTDESRIAAGRMLPGDALDVQIEKLDEGPPLRVRVTFHAIAD